VRRASSGRRRVEAWPHQGQPYLAARLEAYLVIVVVGRKPEPVRVNLGLNGLGRVGGSVRGADRGRGTDGVIGRSWDQSFIGHRMDVSAEMVAVRVIRDIRLIRPEWNLCRPHLDCVGSAEPH